MALKDNEARLVWNVGAVSFFTPNPVEISGGARS